MPSSSDPRDVADMLEALARRLRHEGGGPAERLVPTLDAEALPLLGAADVMTDERAVTVTMETRHADASLVKVSILEGRLLIGVGEGPTATRRDLALPAQVDEDGAVATFRNGILDVVLPLKRR
jgi:HSP20 family molecular chaperone IbpA